LNENMNSLLRTWN